jgi:hypothetical protein
MRVGHLSTIARIKIFLGELDVKGHELQLMRKERRNSWC